MSKVDSVLELKSESIEDQLLNIERILEIISANASIENDIKRGNMSVTSQGLLNRIVKENKDIICLLALTDAEGKVIGADAQNPEILEKSLADRSYYQRALDAKRPVASDVILSKSKGNQIVAIANPLYMNNRYVGSIVASIEFSVIVDAIKDLVIGENGYAYLLENGGDDHGELVYHKDQSLIGENLYTYGIEDLNAVLDEMITEGEGSGHYTFQGISKFVKYKNVGGWTLVLTANTSDLERTANEILNLTVLVLILTILLSIGVCYYIVVNTVINPLKKLELSMDAAGNGDLTHRVKIDTRDEIEHLGRCYNSMLENQKTALKTINEISNEMSASAEELTASAEEVNGASEEISSSVENIMRNVSEQNERLKISRVEVDEIHTVIGSSKLVTHEANQLCKGAQKVTQLGHDNLNKSIQSMKNISDSTDVIIEDFVHLSANAKDVSGVSSIIQSIAEQINLLALNATIEAARAGDYGRGFAVVADEVRKLAEQTSKESDNISMILDRMTAQIENADQHVLKTKSHVSDGRKRVKILDRNLVTIMDTFNQLEADIQKLDAVAVKQVTYADEIRDNIGHVVNLSEVNTNMVEVIVSSTEEQAAITENLQAASEETSAMAESLHGLIDRFTIE